MVLRITSSLRMQAVRITSGFLPSPEGEVAQSASGFQTAQLCNQFEGDGVLRDPIAVRRGSPPVAGKCHETNRSHDLEMPLMPLELAITPHGNLALRDAPPAEESSDSGAPCHVAAAFAESSTRGLLYLATSALQTSLPASLDFGRQFSRSYLTRLCHTPTGEASDTIAPVPPPSPAELATWVLQAPPMLGLEYLTPEALARLVERPGCLRPRRNPAPCRRCAGLSQRTESPLAIRGAGHVSPGREQARPGISFRIPGHLCQPVVDRRVALSTSHWGGHCSNMPGRKTAALLVAARAAPEGRRT